MTVAGALLTAALCLASTQPSDNLAPAVFPTILLAALLGWLWRRAVQAGRPG